MLAKNIREKILKHYPEEDLEKWFDPLVLSYPEIDTNKPAGRLSELTVRFPHKLFADWWVGNYRDKFEHAIESCLGLQADIIYYCHGVPKMGYISKSGCLADFSAPARFAASSITTNEEPEQNFDNFIFNRKNQFPHVAAKNFACAGSKDLLILFGPSGCGKTHLIQAIYNEIKKNVNKKSIFINKIAGLETFFLNAFKNDQSHLSYLRNFKFIIIDDLDMVESYSLIQEQLISLVECAHVCSINMALTMRQKPGAMSLINAKLRSLLEASLVIEVKKPDLDVRRQYVEYSSKNLNFHIRKDDALALARMYSDFHQIYGALLKISSFRLLSKQAANAKLADILQTSVSDDQKRISPDHIIGSVAEYFKISQQEITGKKRSQDIVQARHVAMYLCRELLGAQLGHIGACFSDRDHSSVLYSVNKISKMIKSNKDMHNLVTEVKNIIMK